MEPGAFDEKNIPPQETGRPSIGRLGDFDMEYFKILPDEDGKTNSWLAMGQENCKNQRYFTVYGADNEKLGIIGVYDAADGQNITHTVVDPKYRGHGLAAAFKEKLMDELGLPFVTLTIDLENTNFPATR